jgi:cytosine/adenosine deaminase-related metal-dependent hydrolase
MTRTLFAGGLLVDGTGADPAVADITVEEGRILEIGRGLDGDERVDLGGKAVLPGLFDCHVHVVVSTIDEMRNLHTPFS